MWSLQRRVPCQATVAPGGLQDFICSWCMFAAPLWAPHISSLPGDASVGGVDLPLSPRLQAWLLDLLWSMACEPTGHSAYPSRSFEN